MNNKANINVIIRLRINSDGEGVRTVVFFYGCPLICAWCCNPETRFGVKYTELNINEFYDLISRDLIYFEATNGGVTFSGGEPLLYSDFIKCFLSEHNNLNANIETSLYASFNEIEKIIPHINEWYIDFKMFDEKKHQEFTGVSNDLIKSNIEILSKTIDRNKIILTFPIVTGLNDSEENINQMIGFMKKCQLNKVELHPYRKNSEKKYKSLGVEHMVFDDLPLGTYHKIKKMFEDEEIEVVSRNTLVERSKCDVLKAIRRNYCEGNNIGLKIEECTYQGRCVGTCPKCEEELEFINEWRINNAKFKL